MNPNTSTPNGQVYTPPSNPYSGGGFSSSTNNATQYNAPSQQTGQVSGTPTNNNQNRDPHINPATGVWDDNYFASRQIPTPQNPQAMQQVNPLYDQGNQILENAIGGINGTQSSIIGGLQQSQTAGEAQIGSDLKDAQGNIVSQRASQDQTATNAMSEARRNAAELIQGQRSRGNSTGDAGFNEALIGRSTQQNVGNLQQNLGQNFAKLDEASRHIQELAGTHLQELKSSVANAIADARTKLQGQITSIRLSQDANNSHKADMTYNAIQTYQQQVNNVQAMNAQMENQIKQTELYLQSNINGYRQQYSQQTPNLASPAANVGSNMGVGNPAPAPASNAINFAGFNSNNQIDPNTGQLIVR